MVVGGLYVILMNEHVRRDEEFSIYVTTVGVV